MYFRHFWGASKRADLLQSLTAKNFNSAYSIAKPSKENRLSFRPENVAENYSAWPTLITFADESFAGIAEDRRKSLFGHDRSVVESDMRKYFDTDTSWDDLKRLLPKLTKDVPRYNAKETREKVLGREQFSTDRLLRYSLRPFDVQWCYYTPVRSLWREPRPEYWKAFKQCKLSIVGRFNQAKQPEGTPFTYCSTLCDYHMIAPNATIMPLYLPPKEDNVSLFQRGERSIRANLSKPARKYLDKIGIKDPDESADSASLIWLHALAIGYSPAYLAENADGIRRDWPRIPLPAKRSVLLASAALGKQLAALLDTEADVPGVTTGKVTPALKTIGLISKQGGGAIDPDSDLALTAGWGHAGKEGVTMPGTGLARERPYTADERKALDNCGAGILPALLGDACFDIYLNERAYWRCVPARVWDYYIGGYQVIKKWLSYREHKLLGRPITDVEAREVTNMARRIAAILLLTPALDANYRAVTAQTLPLE